MTKQTNFCADRRQSAQVVVVFVVLIVVVAAVVPPLYSALLLRVIHFIWHPLKVCNSFYLLRSCCCHVCYLFLHSTSCPSLSLSLATSPSFILLLFQSICGLIVAFNNDCGNLSYWPCILLLPHSFDAQLQLMCLCLFLSLSLLTSRQTLYRQGSAEQAGQRKLTAVEAVMFLSALN